MLKQTSFLLLTLTCFCFCNSPLKTQRSGLVTRPMLELNKSGDALNKIVFLTYEVVLVDSAKDEYSFSLVNKTFSNGTLKKDLAPNDEIKDASYFYYEFAGGQNKLNKQYKVLNPLNLTLEYPEENGTLNKKTVSKKKGELTIRFVYEEQLKSISIFKVTPNSINLKKIYNASL